jgi:hypothetical protein
MLGHIAADPDRALVACYEVLARWRELLSRQSPALSAEAAIGLFAELVTLQRIVRADSARRIDCWAGPTGASHDFVSPDVHLEIKASRRREGRFVEIHGAEQLAAGTGRSLFLVYNRVEVAEQGRTIAAVVEELRAEGVDQPMLSSLLRRAGWDGAEGAADAYVIGETRTYSVDADFPKVVPMSFSGGGVPPGVLRLRYEIDLTGEPPRPLSAAEDEALIRHIAGRP